jgi:hypothetical protein
MLYVVLNAVSLSPSSAYSPSFPDTQLGRILQQNACHENVDAPMSSSIAKQRQVDLVTIPDPPLLHRPWVAVLAALPTLMTSCSSLRRPCPVWARR